MMTQQKEIELSQRIRLLSRQYCDGEFNKGEYRRRRRQILEMCVGQDVGQTPAEPEPVELLEPEATSPSTNWVPYVMVTATLGVVAIIGFLLFSLS